MMTHSFLLFRLLLSETVFMPQIIVILCDFKQKFQMERHRWMDSPPFFHGQINVDWVSLKMQNILIKLVM